MGIMDSEKVFNIPRILHEEYTGNMSVLVQEDVGDKVLSDEWDSLGKTEQASITGSISDPRFFTGEYNSLYGFHWECSGLYPKYFEEHLAKFWTNIHTDVLWREAIFNRLTK
ncbi:hypothetical protein IW152_006131, partial [Coemansia sp. BCRC 34962]